MPLPLQPAGDIVTIEIKVNGTIISDSYVVERVTATSALNQIPMARVTLADGDPATGDFAASSSDDFIPGAEIEIKAGYNARNATIFKGVILGQRIRVRDGKQSNLIVECHDKAIRTTIGRGSRQFIDQTDAEAMRSLIQGAGLKAEVEDTGFTHPQQVKDNATDWDFIRARAAANGQLVHVGDGTITVARPTFGRAAHVAQMGENIIAVNLDLNARDQLPDVTATAWDPAAQATISGPSTEPGVNSQGNLTGQELSKILDLPGFDLTTHATPDAGALSGWASAQLLQSRLSRITGNLTILGTAVLGARDLLELRGLGDRFNGASFVAGVHHDLRDGGWQTTVDVGLDADLATTGDAAMTAAPAAGLRPGVNGLRIATVLQTHEDPSGERRIKVKIPLHGGDAPGLWVRLASPYASAGAGMNFLPEVDDEVVLGFLDEDPDAGIVLGALHSSGRDRPFEADAQNTVKGILTPEQLKISFDDDKKAITIETPGGHSLLMDDDGKALTLKDGNGNSLEMSQGGIKITSEGTIGISAAGDLSVSSAADVDLEGTTITAEASAAIKVTGGATAELSAGGQTTVKGSIVMIN